MLLFIISRQKWFCMLIWYPLQLYWVEWVNVEYIISYQESIYIHCSLEKSLKIYTFDEYFHKNDFVFVYTISWSYTAMI